MLFERISLAAHPGNLPDAIALRFNPTHGDASYFERFGVVCPSSVARAVPKRKAEYLAGRRVAIHSLREAGIDVADLGTGSLRAPLWPDGYTGSITHSHDMAAAVAPRKGEVSGVGIDLEPVASTDAMVAIMQVALSPSEQLALNPLALHVGEPAAVTIAFSAKESFYKATAAGVGRFFDFAALRITSVSVDRGFIEAKVAEVLAPNLMPGCEFLLGFSALGGDVVFTSCAWCR